MYLCIKNKQPDADIFEQNYMYTVGREEFVHVPSTVCERLAFVAKMW